ncbi:MAG: hypothetical protein M3P06_11575 [Acidobacteriota bacterium]|nr:hypothetical protein [Acidobacteriota bacterium]
MLRSIASYYDEHGHAPSIRDLEERLGLSSPSVAMYWIRALMADGYLTMCDKCPHATTRTLKLTAAGLAMVKVVA